MKLRRDFTIEISDADQTHCSVICEFQSKGKCIFFGELLDNAATKEPLRCVPCMAYFKTSNQIRVCTDKDIGICSEKTVGSSTDLNSGTSI